MTTPLPLKYDGDGMFSTPNAYWRRRADELYVVGQTYAMEEVQQRSSPSHAHYFASVNEAWGTLPDHLAAQFPNPTALRKRALILTGFCDQTTVAAATKAEAQRIAALVPMFDPYAMVLVDGPRVTILRAKSQKYRAMDRKTFQASKDAVLGWIGDLIGVTGGELARQGRAA